MRNKASLVVFIFFIIFFSCGNDNSNDDMPNDNDLILEDIDGNTYSVVQICNQKWMAENLNVSKYRNGDIIPQVQDSTQWTNLTTGAWCYYENNTTSGKLYNWYAANDPRGLAPEGWKIPTNENWNELVNCLGGEEIAGGKLKSVGTIEDGDGLWYEPNIGATNESGFNALPIEHRSYLGWWYDAGYAADFMSLTEGDYIPGHTNYGFELYFETEGTSLFQLHKRNGIHIRCLEED